jgi:hypothetical protein
MSLTSFLDIKDVREKFKAVFPKPTHSMGVMLAPPLTKNYSLVGTAFDYLMRFYLQRKLPFAVAKSWIASYSMVLLTPGSKSHRFAQLILNDAEQHHAQYLQTDLLTQELLRSCLLLAQLDPVFRRHAIVPNLGQVEEADVEDLRQLVSIIPENFFQPKQTCLLDPIFGSASRLVSGADVDLVMDDTIVDIKTTINPMLQRGHYHQIIGYYILYCLNGFEMTGTNIRIKNLAIYSSRYRYLLNFPVDNIATDQTFLDFSKWFAERAKSEFGND